MVLGGVKNKWENALFPLLFLFFEKKRTVNADLRLAFYSTQLQSGINVIGLNVLF